MTRFQIISYVLKYHTLTQQHSWLFWAYISEIYSYGGYAKNPTLEQKCANQALHYRRLRIEHVHSSVKRCRIVKDRIRLWKEGVRDLVRELCCTLHNFRVRLIPWQSRV
jgi:hypothetical protein